MPTSSNMSTTPSGFVQYDLPAALVGVLSEQGITTPTPVQEAVIPDALSGRDVLGRARTGSGKTLAFGIPLLVRLAGGTRHPKAPRGLIVLPTRELANQVREALDPIADAMGMRLATVYGGTPYDRQIKRLRSGVDVVIATPGRLTDLIDRGACRLDRIEVAVLDEADHLCDLGFFKPIDALLSKTPAGGQRLLLSATLDGQVDRLVRRHLRNQVLHELDPSEGQVSTVEHHVLVTGGDGKVATTKALLEANPRSIVFTRTRRGAMNLARQLTRKGVQAVDLHGDLDQRMRERNLARFSAGQATVIVATDVAARGIHIDNVGLVVHYDLPPEPKAYLHRSGRTARAGEAGAVVTMATTDTVDDVIKLQHTAGIEARHHAYDTAPKPMTVEALSGAGRPAPVLDTARRGSAGGSRGRNAGGGSRRPGAGRGRRGPARAGQRHAAARTR